MIPFQGHSFIESGAPLVLLLNSRQKGRRLSVHRAVRFHPSSLRKRAKKSRYFRICSMERATRLELATSTLARWRSTRWATAAYSEEQISVLLKGGASDRNRTNDTGIFSPLLYRLSYRGAPDDDYYTRNSGFVKRKMQIFSKKIRLFLKNASGR